MTTESCDPCADRISLGPRRIDRVAKEPGSSNENEQVVDLDMYFVCKLRGIKNRSSRVVVMTGARLFDDDALIDPERQLDIVSFRSLESS